MSPNSVLDIYTYSLVIEPLAELHNHHMLTISQPQSLLWTLLTLFITLFIPPLYLTKTETNLDPM